MHLRTASSSPCSVEVRRERASLRVMRSPSAYLFFEMAPDCFDTVAPRMAASRSRILSRIWSFSAKGFAAVFSRSAALSLLIATNSESRVIVEKSLELLPFGKQPVPLNDGIEACSVEVPPLQKLHQSKFVFGSPRLECDRS